MTGLVNAERFERAVRTPAEERNLATVRAVFEAFARSDFTFLPSCLAPGAEMAVVGVEPAKLAGIAKVLPNGMRFTLKRVAVDGDFVLVEWEDEAVTARGTTYRNDGVSLFGFDAEGKVTSYREYLDPARFLAIL